MRRSPALPVPMLLGIIALVTTACSEGGEGLGQGSSAATASKAAPVDTKLDQVVEWIDTIQLEENSSVINVWPHVRQDPRGGFLVADQKERQIRGYAPDGGLRFHFGSAGPGPGQFDGPMVAVRLASGRILAVDNHSKASIWTEAGDSLLRTVSIPLWSVQDADVLNDSLVLIAGLPEGTVPQPGAHVPWLHVLNLRTDTIVRSFFSPPVSKDNQTVARVARWAAAAVHGDTIAAITAIQDTVYLFSLDGEPGGKLHIPSRHLRSPQPPPPEIRTNPRARIEWMGTFDLVASVDWAPGGTFLIKYESYENGVPVWHLLRMARTDGKLVFDVQTAPQLLVTTAGGSRLYFVTPDAETPNRWSSARLKDMR